MPASNHNEHSWTTIKENLQRNKKVYSLYKLHSNMVIPFTFIVPKMLYARTLTVNNTTMGSQTYS